MAAAIKTAYSGNQIIQESFGIGSYQNIALTAVDAFSAPMTSQIVVLSCMDPCYLEINGVATTASVVIPAGYTKLIVNIGDVLHFVRGTAVDSNLAIINPS